MLAASKGPLSRNTILTLPIKIYIMHCDIVALESFALAWGSGVIKHQFSMHALSHKAFLAIDKMLSSYNNAAIAA